MEERNTRSSTWINDVSVLGTKIRTKMHYEISLELDIKVQMHQGSVLSLFLPALVVDFVTELANEVELSKLTHIGHLFVMCERVDELKNKFRRLKENYEEGFKFQPLKKLAVS